MQDLFFKGTPQLETERLILRKLTLQDADDIFAYGSDPEVSRFMTWETHQSIEETKSFINFILDKYEKDEAGEWGIVLKSTGKLIGSVGIPRYDLQNKSAEIGYVLSRKYWGQGIMPEAVSRVLQFAFEEMGLNRIESCHYVRNEKSGRVMQKVGMSFEGVVREKIFAKNKFWDVKQYAILRSDWEKRHGRLG
ncbi:MAG: GNAT family N-acetyltransferase [Firmicutes bacterium]|nr:GNAT family N-acetyltransferase [Bacillota bacterium]